MSKTKFSKPKASTLYSHHVFLFPFKWAPFPEDAQNLPNFVEQTKLKPIADEFYKHSSVWKSKAFEIDTILGYTEYNYFLDYVREILYDLHEDGSSSTGTPAPKRGKAQEQSAGASPLYPINSGTKEVIQHFEYVRTPGAMEYRIQLDQRKEPYVLEIESFFLHLYYTGVGVFSFHLNNRRADQAAPEDILAINQYGRRIYPIYFDIDQDAIGTHAIFEDKNFAEGLRGAVGKRNQGAQKEVLAEYIEVQLGGKTITEDFADYHDYKNFKYTPFLLPKFIKEFLPDGLFCTHENPEAPERGRYTINPAMDDRMFVVCWYGNPQLSEQLRQAFLVDQPYRAGKIITDYQAIEPALDWWYKYVFVNSKLMTCQNAELRWKNILASSNLRWRDQGTFYGITGHSLVMLSTDLAQLKKDNRGFLVTYLQTIYYKLVELVLVQRATVERFADEVTHISRFESKDLSYKVSALYKQYIRFVNKIYFREVTAQALGSELYETLQEQANVSKNVKDLDDEIQELHAYVQQTQERKRNRRLELISSSTAAFLGPSLLIGFYGVNTYPELYPQLRVFSLFWLILCALATGFLSSRIFKESSNGVVSSGSNRRMGYALVPFVLGMLFPLFAPLINPRYAEQPHKQYHSSPRTSNSDTTSSDTTLLPPRKLQH